MDAALTREVAENMLHDWEWLFYAEQFGEGIERFKAAKALFKENGDWANYARASCRLGHFYVSGKAADLHKAKEELEEVLQMARNGNEAAIPPGILVEAYGILGACFGKMRELEAAFGHVEKARRLCNRHLGEKSVESANLFKILAGLHQAGREHERAIQCYAKALSIYKEALGGESLEVAYACNQMGLEYAANHNFGMAEGCLKKSLNLYLQTWGEKHIAVAKLYANLGAINGRAGRLGKARHYLEKAVGSYEHLEGCEAYLAILCHNLGVLCTEKSEHPEAERWLHKSLKLQLAHMGECCVLGSDNHYSLAKLHFGGRQYGKAETHALESLDLAVRLSADFHPFAFTRYGMLGDIRFELGDMDGGISLHQKAIKCLVPDFDPGHEYDNPAVLNRDNARELVEALGSKASCLWRRYLARKTESDLTAADGTFQLTLDWIDQIRQGYDTEDSKMSLLGDNATAQVYINAFRCSLELHRVGKGAAHLENAFKASEKCRANILLGQLSDLAALGSANIPPALLKKEAGLKAELARLQTEIQRLRNGPAHSETEIGRLEGRRFDIGQAYRELVKQFETDHPDYHQLKHRVETVSISELQKSLKPGTALLEYLVANGRLFVIVVTGADAAVESVPLPEGFGGLLEDFRAALLLDDGEMLAKTSGKLHALLIAPASKHLDPSGKDAKIGHLIIVPHEQLHYLPFELLRPSRNGTGSLLLQNYSISYHYSATLWHCGLRRSEKAATASDGFFGFAPVAFSGNAAAQNHGYVAKSQAGGRRPGTAILKSGVGEAEALQDLRQTEGEVRSIYRLFERRGKDAMALFYGQANKTNLKDFVGNYKYVLISTHGFVRQTQDGAVSGIYLAPKPGLNPSQPEHGKCIPAGEGGAALPAQKSFGGEPSGVGEDASHLLFADEAYGLRLSADLVVLSSCESGIGQLAKGEGMMALNRGFLYAGARNIIHSLFPIPERASRELAERLFEQVLAGESYAQALRKAKLDMMEKEGVPARDWAGLVLVGGG